MGFKSTVMPKLKTKTKQKKVKVKMKNEIDDLRCKSKKYSCIRKTSTIACICNIL